MFRICMFPVVVYFTVTKVGYIKHTKNCVFFIGFVFCIFQVAVYVTVAMIGNIKNTKTVCLPQGS